MQAEAKSSAARGSHKYNAQKYTKWKMHFQQNSKARMVDAMSSLLYGFEKEVFSMHRELTGQNLEVSNAEVVRNSLFSILNSLYRKKNVAANDCLI